MNFWENTIEELSTFLKYEIGSFSNNVWRIFNIPNEE